MSKYNHPHDDEDQTTDKPKGSFLVRFLLKFTILSAGLALCAALLIGMALLVSHLWARYLSRGEITAEKRRIQLVWVRNIIWFAALLIIVSVWASTIAGFALSVAAVAGAILIVSKELVMCVHGYLYATLVQPYKIGDVIEFNQLRGRVVDIDMFATTLVELDKAGQRTGKVAGATRPAAAAGGTTVPTGGKG